MAITRSPTATPVTSAPHSLITPATSNPGEHGGSGRIWYLPSLIRLSGKLIAAALTVTTTWPAAARGDGTSSTTSVSGGPNFLRRSARIVGGLSGCPAKYLAQSGSPHRAPP